MGILAKIVKHLGGEDVRPIKEETIEIGEAVQMQETEEQRRAHALDMVKHLTAAFSLPVIILETDISDPEE